MASVQATWARVLLPPAITAVATLVAAVIGVRMDAPGTELLFPTPTTTAIATATTTVTAVATTTVTVTPTPIPPPGGTPTPIADVTYLADMKPIPPGGNLDRRSTRTINKTAYSHALSNSMGGCGESGPVEWAIGAGVERFVADVGLDEAVSRIPTARVRFTVTLDGRQITPPRTVGVGPPQHIDVSVKNGLRLKLSTALVQGYEKDGCISEAVAVWGDAALTAASS